ncbi:hypothetical protein V6N13_077309 [Hibiscus sabdariffa]
MENGVEKESGSMMFSEEELKEVSGLKKGGDFVEVTCGCTSHRYGDAVGKLRVFSNGHLEIACECTPGCNEDKLSPAAFEKHSGRETARKWKNNIWLMVNGEKVSLSKTAFLKYYNQASKSIHKSHNGRVRHRDEFVRCSGCNKERRLRLRAKEECRIHHDALADANWKCSDLLYDRITCDDDEERASRRERRSLSLEYRPFLLPLELDILLLIAKALSSVFMVLIVLSANSQWAVGVGYTTATECLKEDEATSKDNSQLKHKSPAKATKKRPTNGDPAGVRARRESARGRGRGSSAARTVQRNVGSRSRSPGTGRASGASNGAVGKSPTTLTGKTDNKTTSKASAAADGQSKREEDEKNEESEQQQQGSESIENPHVSLECFIFL